MEWKKMKGKWERCLIFGIIALLVGISIFPTMGRIVSNNINNSNNKTSNQIDNLFTNAESALEIDDYSIPYQAVLNRSEKLFDLFITKIMEMGHLSAMSGAIIKDNEVVWAKGFGLYDREKNKSANEETIYLVASISKTITATALMQLHEKGLFDLDDDVNDYLPFNLRNPNHPGEPITFRMLLAHQSSLAEDPPCFSAYIPGDPSIPGYPHPWLKEYLLPGGINYKPQVWTDKHPGEEMNYANVGFSLIGYLVEQLTGQSFEEYCRKNIFAPLNMSDSSFRLSGVNISRLAVPYIFQFGEYFPLLHYGIIDYPAGGLRTTILNLSHFLIAHMNGGVYNGVRILEEETVEKMHTIQYHSHKYSFQYGLGWQIWNNGESIGHTGGLYGVSTNMKFRVSDNVGIIFFTNKGITNIRELMAFSLIERLLFWKADGGEMEKLPMVFKPEETMMANEQLMKNPMLTSYRY